MAPPSPTALADTPSSPSNADRAANPNFEHSLMKPNQDLPARSMSEEAQDSHVHEDDAATIAAGEELKQTTISDKEQILEEKVTTTAEPIAEDKVMEGTSKSTTPEPAVTEKEDELMRERISSPKKKRGRDDDEAKDIDSPEKIGESAEGLNGSRTFREKKRPRDTTGDSPDKGAPKSKDLSDTSPTASSDSESKRSRNSSPKPVFGSNLVSNKPQTSSSAFANSGFASLASSSSSPFGTVGASSPSVFGGGKPSGFGALAGANAPLPTATTTTTSANTSSKPATGFGFGGASTASGFGSLKTSSVFGSSLGNGFAGGAGPKLSSFAAPSTVLSQESAKPAKAFGAPESDDEEDSGDNDGDGSADESGEDFGKAVAEEKRKIKPIKIEDGESGEATLLQVRAKLFAMESKESGWKERGSGTLKVNIPKSCATFDHLGVAIPGSFDISGLEDEDDENAPRVPRLIMRQDNTHRVILNSTIIRPMEFADKPSGQGGVQYLFTTLSDPKPIQMLLRMNENNGRLFRSEIDSIQHEL